jgi:hypothetical protein
MTCNYTQDFIFVTAIYLFFLLSLHFVKSDKAK